MNALFSRLAQLTPPPGSFALIPLGQHSFLLKLGKVTLGLDLYLTLRLGVEHQRVFRRRRRFRSI